MARGLSAFGKTVARSIRGSLGRFFAILGIAALGCGFYAGLQMCGPDMRAAADALYDGTDAYDVRLVSTLGFTDKDVDRVKQAMDTDKVMPGVSVDAMARLNSEQLAIRISTLNVEAAEKSTEEDSYAIASRDGAYLNRVFLREGRLPQAADECVVGADKDVAGVAVGDTIEVLYGTTDLKDVLASTTFTVVGKVSASVYPYTGSFGSTTLGSGMIGEYVYVAPQALVDEVPYTEMYLSADGAAAQESGSDAYQEAVDAVTSELEENKADLAQGRLDDIRADANDELDEAKDELDKAKREAADELGKAKDELDKAADELASGERDYKSGLADYEQGVRELDEQRANAEAQFASAEAELATGKKKLEDSKAELEKAKETYGKGKKDYETGLAKLLKETGVKDLEGAVSALNDQKAQVNEGRNGLDTARGTALTLAQGLEQTEAWEQGRSQLLEALAQQGMAAQTLAEAQQMLGAALVVADDPQAKARLESALETANQLASAGTEETMAAQRAQLEEGERQLLGQLADQGITAEDAASAPAAIDAALPALDQASAQIDEGLEGASELKKAKEQLDAAEAKIASGEEEVAKAQKKLDDGAEELAQQRTQAEGRIADAQRQLDEAKAKLDDAEAKLADGREELKEGQESYAQAKEEAEDKIADGQAKIDDAQADIDELEAPDLYLLDRSQNEGMLTYDADSRRMDSIADVFPFIFFLVAALVSLTTMTRMVDDDRIEIGTYKALGYSTARIASKYLIYAGLAAGIGAVLGVALLSQVLPFIVTSAYSIIYTVPLHPFPIPIDLGIAFASGGLGVGVTLLATWAAVVASLRETPATLMLPRAPAAGKRILLERIGPLWRRLSFSRKVTCRNLFRYKRRLAMTVIGISGCTALLLVGFGLHDAIWDIIDCQYGPIIHYNTTVGLNDDATTADVDEVTDFLETDGVAQDIIRVHQENMQAGLEVGGETIRVQVIIPESSDQLAEAVTLRERVGHAPLAFGPDAVVITEKLSTKYGIAVGDPIRLFEQDTIGNVVGEGFALTVTGIAENYVGNLVYLGEDAWRQIDQERPVFSTIYATVADTDEVREGLAEDLHDFDSVSTVIFSDETINLYRNMLSVVDMIVVVLIVSAGLLAFIVLYNLTNINIGERVREIASLKVLGFTPHEVYAYIFREIILLAVLGDALGMVLGTFLERFVSTTAEVDYVMFGRTIHPLSYAYAFALTLIFAGLILVLMRKKLDRVNMVESLKSVE